MSPEMDIELSVSQFVALHNQVLEYSMPMVVIVGELANFRVSKGKWLYFDLKDDGAVVRFFGTVYNLNGPLEDGMLLKVRGTPRVHPLYGFSINVLTLQPAGEGTIKRAAELLQSQLEAEGLFAPERKRSLPYPPGHIGLITSKESAAYADFMKILDARWRGIDILVANVQVQGEVAPEQIVQAINDFNQLADPPEVLILTRGGGSPEDLWAFSSEAVTRAVAGSRIPTLVAIGHEIDISLAELAADQRASTPSNAAELLVPDRANVLRDLQVARQSLGQLCEQTFRTVRGSVILYRQQLMRSAAQALTGSRLQLKTQTDMLRLLNPAVILKRGYAIVRAATGVVVRAATDVQPGETLEIQFADSMVRASVERTS